jgi:hypothetical protein
MNMRELAAIFFVPKESNSGTSSPEKGGDAANPSEPPPSPLAGDFDLSNIYREKGIPPVPFSAEQALDLLGSWLRAETRGQGFSDLLKEKNPAAVAEDAKLKIDALTAAAEHLPGEFADFIASTQNEIANLEAEIRDKREAIERAQAQGDQIAQLCRSEAERLKSLLQFLG